MALGYKNGVKLSGALFLSGSVVSNVENLTGSLWEPRLMQFVIDTTLGSGLPEYASGSNLAGSGQTQAALDEIGLGYLWGASDGLGFALDFGDGTITRLSTTAHTYSSGGVYTVTYIGNIGQSTSPDGAKVTDVKSFGQAWKRAFGGPFNFPNAQCSATTVQTAPVMIRGPQFLTMPVADFDATNFWGGFNLENPTGHGGSKVIYDMNAFNNDGIGGVGVGVDTWSFPGDIDYATGQNTSVATNQLIDSGATFIDDEVNDYPMVVLNVTTGKSALMTGTATQTTISLAADIFTNVGDTYRVNRYWPTNSVFGGMFQNWTVFNQYIGSWTFKGNTSMDSAFRGWGSFNNGDAAGVSGGGVGIGMDNFDTRNCTNFSKLFLSDGSFNQYIGSWDVGNVTNFGEIFRVCTSFNQPLPWNVGARVNITTVGAAFAQCTVFNQDLGSWDVSGSTNFSQTFDRCPAFNNGGVNTGVGVGLDTWDVSSGESFYQTFRQDTSFNCYLGSWTLNTTPGTDVSFRNTWADCTIFDGTDLGNWDTRNVNNWEDTFQNTSVNFPITHPNYWEIHPTPIVIRNPFLGSPFNGGQASGVGGRNAELKIGTDPADEYSLENWFNSASDFNQDCSTDTVNGYWVMTRVVNVSSLFASTKFNQDISNWDVQNVTNFKSLFQLTPFDNAGVGGIGVGLDTWNVGSALDMSGMFRSTPFRHDLNNWNTSNVQNMSAMWYGWQSLGNDSIFSSWDVSSVTNMSMMFRQGNSNPDVGGWNTSSLEDCSLFVEGNGGFSRDISGWNIGNLLNASTMMTGSAFGTTNYDLLLDSTTGWASQATIQSAVTLGMGNNQYTLGGNAEAGRNILTGTYGWTITDGGGI